MSSLEGPALLDAASAPGRGWGEVLTVVPDAGAGRQVGPGAREQRGCGDCLLSPVLRVVQANVEASRLCHSQGQGKSRLLDWPAMADTGSRHHSSLKKALGCGLHPRGPDFVQGQMLLSCLRAVAAHSVCSAWS